MSNNQFIFANVVGVYTVHEFNIVVNDDHVLNCRTYQVVPTPVSIEGSQSNVVPVSITNHVLDGPYRSGAGGGVASYLYEVVFHVDRLLDTSRTRKLTVI